jgi:hypothetical protein
MSFNNTSTISSSLSKCQLEIIIALFLIFSLNYYVYVYFYPFNEGTSAAPAAVKAIKDFAYLALFGIVAWKITLRSAANDQFVFVPLGAALVLTSLLHSAHTGIVPQLWENVKNIVIFIPVYMAMFHLTDDQRDRVTMLFFWILIVVVALQTIFSALYIYSGNLLWVDGSYVGFIANPNSFALVVNLAACALLMVLRSAPRSLLVVCLLVLALLVKSLLESRSHSQIAILVFLMAYGVLFHLRYWQRYALAVAVVAGVFVWQADLVRDSIDIYAPLVPEFVPPVAPPPTAPAVPGTGVIVAVPPPLTDSVTLRVQNFMDAIGVLFKGPVSAILGDFDTPRFIPMDGQFWVFLFNGGLLTMLAFVFGCAFVYLKSLVHIWRNPEDGKVVGLHLMLVVFGITFIASRVLMYFPLNFIFFMVCGLAMAGLKARQKSRGRQGLVAAASAANG